jgi:hypothetical protein
MDQEFYAEQALLRARIEEQRALLEVCEDKQPNSIL